MRLAHYQGAISDGDKVLQATISVYDQNSNLADLFEDGIAATAKANPFVTTAFGEIDFYVAAGEYLIEAASPSITTKQWATVMVSDPADANRDVDVADYGAVGDGPGKADRFLGAVGVSFLTAV